MNAGTTGVEVALDMPLNAVASQAAPPDSVKALLREFTSAFESEMIDFRRDLHRHPEASNEEFRTTQKVAERLEKAGLEPRLMPGSTGLLCDIPGLDPSVPMLALRADLDALPVTDEKAVPYRSTVPGFCHACGHDVHTASVLGAGLALAELSKERGLPTPVRLLFQPAEEKIAGAQFMIKHGVLEGVGRILALHCDPKIDVGRVGLKTGPLTSACDLVKLTVKGGAGEGGETMPPNVVHAVAALTVGVPAAVSQQMPTGSGVSIVWGHAEANSGSESTGALAPDTGFMQCTIRCIDERAWTLAENLFRKAVENISALHGVTPDLEYTRGIPPVVNEATSVALLRRAADEVLGRSGVTYTEQSLGGEDFAWFVRKVPGAMARLGVRTAGAERTLDLHQGLFDADERAIGVAMRLLSGAALLS
ncbi:amidohydrolase [Streptomyces coeruleorubidus]|uniref:amidohydrolase n=1 Tax=Streptomyces coeruleorubidus TaxID=116188 RepID=UPI0036FDB971